MKDHIKVSQEIHRLRRCMNQYGFLVLQKTAISEENFTFTDVAGEDALGEILDEYEEG